MSLITCLKRAGKALGDRDKAAILAYSRQHRAAGLDTDTAAKRAVEDHLKDIEGQLAKAEEAFKAAPKESTQLAVGTTPGNTEPVTVRDGVIHIGKYEALNFDTGEPVKAPDGATPEDLQRLLKEAGSITSRQKFFNRAEAAPAETAAKRGVDLADGPPLTTSDVRAAVQKIAGNWENGPAVHVVLSAHELPGDVPGNVRGLYTRDQGVWVVASLNRSRKALAKTLAHEAVAHYGLRDMLGRDRWQRLMANIDAGVQAGDKTLMALRDEVRKTYVDKQGKNYLAPAAEADEIAAAAVEKAVGADGQFRPGFEFLKGVYARVAEFLRELGINVRFTHAELQGMLTLAQKHLQAGERTAGAQKVTLTTAHAEDRAEAIADDERGTRATTNGEFPPVTEFDRINVGPGGYIKPRAVAPGQHTFRETDVGGLDERMREDRYAVPFNGYVADREELALGQGMNRGVQLVFRPDSVGGREHSKPMTGDLAGREYRTDLLAPRAVQAIAIWPADLARTRGLTRQRLATDFTRKDLPDGRVLFTRKGLPEVGAPSLQPVEFKRNASGTLAVTGDEATARRALESAGVTRILTGKNGFTVGKTQAELAEKVLAKLRSTDAFDEPAQSRAAAADSAEAGAAEKPEEGKPRAPYKGPGAELLNSTRDVIGRMVNDAFLKVAPMSAGSDSARAVAKDYANAERLARHKWTQFDDVLRKDFTEAERRQMWEAADEQNVLMQKGEGTTGKGLDRLNAKQRKVMDILHAYGESLLQRAREVGMFKGEGLPYWTPRMAVMIGENGEYRRPGEGQTATDEGRGFNVTKTSGNLKQRKYLTAEETEAAMKGALGEGAQLVRDIRTMPLAMARLERAIAGRELINQIRDIGRTSGIDTTATKEGPNFFTVNHPAFKTMVAHKVPIRLSEYFDRKLMGGLTQLADNLGIAHERRGSLKGGSLGLAYRDKPLVQTKFFTPEQVLTHEIGHQIDFKYGLAEQLTKRGVTARELRALADLRYEGQEDEVSDHYKAYVRKASEKIANLVHAYVHNPERFRDVAPETFKWFDDFVSKTPALAPLKDLGPSLTLGKRDVEAKVTQFEERPIYVSKDFEGPLKAILAERSGELYKQMMNLKGKTMGLIMYSPLIHNAVEWGRALPVMPGKVLTFRVYFEGNKLKNDPTRMAQAIKDGMVPIGHRGNIQDITGIVEEPNLAPGRSWTAKLLGGAVGTVHQGAGTAVKKGVDAAGDFWHNTLLWDRVGDLQAGLYGNMREDMIGRGMDEQTAGRLAAHFANRYAGAIPNEAMSANARKIANFVFFSRSFTLGNIGVIKDMVTGFPPDIAAQIQRDAGELALRAGKSVARRKAIAAFALDMALMYAGNAILQSALDKMKRDKTWDEITQGYVDRLHALVHRAQENPLQVLTSPLESLASLTPNSGNEPGKEDRIHFGTDESGTRIYMRSPVGKVGEEFKGWVTSPLEMLLRKQGTVMRPITQTIENDKGFGQRVYNPDDKSWPGIVKNVGRIIWNFMSQQVPADSIQGASDWAHGRADDTDKLKLLGPLAGVTFSKGAPGGPEVGEMYHENKVHQGKVADVMPDVKRALKEGDADKAIELMEGVQMSASQIRTVLRHQAEPSTRLSERALKNYYRGASEESRERMENYGR